MLSLISTTPLDQLAGDGGQNAAHANDRYIPDGTEEERADKNGKCTLREGRSTPASRNRLVLLRA